MDSSPLSIPQPERERERERENETIFVCKSLH